MTELVDDAPSIDGFEVLGRLGGGGFATVWKCREHASGRVVAVKVPRPDMAKPEFLERFDEECMLLLRLGRHPNVVGVIARAVATLPDGRRVPALVMEHIANARTILEHADHRRLHLRGRLALVRAVCAGVAHLHRAGVVHLDLKPGNILVDDDGVPRVMDLGAARVLLSNDVRSAFFTPQYASPEQLRGTPEALDQSSDVYSLGKLLAVIAAGSECIAIDRNLSSEERVRRACEWESQRFAAALPEPDPELESIVARATARSPADRYESASQFGEALAHALTPWSVSIAELLRRTGRRTPRPIRAAAIIMLLAAIAWLGGQSLVDAALGLGVGPPIRASLPVLDAMSHVRVVKVTDDGLDLEQLARSHGAEGVTLANRATLRALHAVVLDRLSAAGAAAVVFDIAFPVNPDAESGTSALVEATRRATFERGCPVVVGGPWSTSIPEEMPGASPTPALIEAGASYGAMHVFPSPEFGWVVALVAQPVGASGGQRPRPSLAIAGVLASRSSHPRAPGALALRPDANVLEVLPADRDGMRIPLFRVAEAPLSGHQGREELLEGTSAGDLYALRVFDVPSREVLDAATLRVDAVLDMEPAALSDRVRGRIVLVSANFVGDALTSLADPSLDPSARAELQSHGDLFELADGALGPKAWIHATLIESVLSGQPASIGTARFRGWLAGAALLGVLLGRPAHVPRWIRRLNASSTGLTRRVLLRAMGILAGGAVVVVLLGAFGQHLPWRLPYVPVTLFVTFALGAMIAIEYRLIRQVWRNGR